MLPLACGKPLPFAAPRLALLPCRHAQRIDVVQTPPQALEDKGGWPNRDLVDHYAEYAAILGKHFGDRITVWAPFNMPWTFCYLGYGVGAFPPGKADNG